MLLWVTQESSLLGFHRFKRCVCSARWSTSCRADICSTCRRFVRPVKMSEERQAEYIKGKYGKWGLDR